MNIFSTMFRRGELYRQPFRRDLANALSVVDEANRRQTQSSDTRDLVNALSVSEASGPLVFIAANAYGLSAKSDYSGEPLAEGDQLCNNRAHGDLFTIKKISNDIIVVESMTTPGLFIGLGEGSGDFESSNPFRAVLVNGEEDNHKLRIVVAKNGSNSYVSFEPASKRGYVLNHCNGIMYFSKVPNWSNLHVFQQDSSWTVRRVETAEERAMRLRPIYTRTDDPSTERLRRDCPCCFEPWGQNRIHVLTECNHVFCIECAVSICNSTAPSISGNCPMCRAVFQFSELRRIAAQDTDS